MENNPGEKYETTSAFVGATISKSGTSCTSAVKKKIPRIAYLEQHIIIIVIVVVIGRSLSRRQGSGGIVRFVLIQKILQNPVLISCFTFFFIHANSLSQKIAQTSRFLRFLWKKIQNTSYSFPETAIVFSGVGTKTVSIGK